MPDTPSRLDQPISQSVTLRDYFDEKFRLFEEATILAREQMEKRLEGMNEFRETLRDQASQMVTRQECQTAHKNVQETLKAVEKWQNVMDGKASQTAVIMVGLGTVISAGLGLAGLLMK